MREIEKEMLKKVAEDMARNVHESESKPAMEKMKEGDTVFCLGTRKNYREESEEKRCHDCNEKCYFSSLDWVKVKEGVKVKFLCDVCAINHKSDMTALQQEIVEKLK